MKPRKTTGPIAATATGPRASVLLASKQLCDSAPLPEVQAGYLRKRFGLAPRVATLLALLAFGEAAR